jgi:gas vesicle protein
MSTSRFLGGLFIGGLIGSLVGLLIAPRRGEETRHMLASDLQDCTQAVQDDVSHQAQDLKTRFDSKSKEILSELEAAGERTVQSIKSTLPFARSTSTDDSSLN